MNTKYVIPLALASFILCPLLTIVFLLIIGITIEKNMTSRGKCTFVVLFGVMCSIFVSLINMVIICVFPCIYLDPVQNQHCDRYAVIHDHKVQIVRAVNRHAYARDYAIPCEKP